MARLCIVRVCALAGMIWCRLGLLYVLGSPLSVPAGLDVFSTPGRGFGHPPAGAVRARGCVPLHALNTHADC